MSRLRQAEIVILLLGAAIALGALLYGSRDAFEGNMRWTQGAERAIAFVATLLSLLVVGLVAMAPYVLQFKLGKRIPRDGSAVPFEIAGLVISILSTIATMCLNYLVAESLADPRGSTTALVMVAAPAYLFVAVLVLYGALVWICRRAAKNA